MNATTTTLQDLRLLGHERVAESTMAFRFGKPAGFTFKPAQAIDLVLPGAPEGAGDAARHAFSLVSAPFERDLMIATRMRDSPFKRALGALEPGAPLQLDGPFGSLTLHNKRARPAIFIAGGIGVTPFMSILRQAAHDELPQSLLLLYSNRRPEDAAFLEELRALERSNRRFRLVATMTGMAHSKAAWDGRTGVIDAELVKSVGAELPDAVHYLAGPPKMVEAMRATLAAAGVDEDDMRSEEFYGY
jgi:ferredoxin-NADP reductase